MLTEWLQMALHLLPDKRGGVASGTPSMEDAPCLVAMDRLLRTRVCYRIAVCPSSVVLYIMRDLNMNIFCKITLPKQHKQFINDSKNDSWRISCMYKIMYRTKLQYFSASII